MKNKETKQKNRQIKQNKTSSTNQPKWTIPLQKLKQTPKENQKPPTKLQKTSNKHIKKKENKTAPQKTKQ